MLLCRQIDEVLVLNNVDLANALTSYVLFFALFFNKTKLNVTKIRGKYMHKNGIRLLINKITTSK